MFVVLNLRGGTNADMAPQIDEFTEVFLANLRHFGPIVEYEETYQTRHCSYVYFKRQNMLYILQLKKYKEGLNLGCYRVKNPFNFNADSIGKKWIRSRI